MQQQAAVTGQAQEAERCARQASDQAKSDQAAAEAACKVRRQGLGFTVYPTQFLLVPRRRCCDLCQPACLMHCASNLSFCLVGHPPKPVAPVPVLSSLRYAPAPLPLPCRPTTSPSGASRPGSRPEWAGGPAAEGLAEAARAGSQAQGRGGSQAPCQQGAWRPQSRAWQGRHG